MLRKTTKANVYTNTLYVLYVYTNNNLVALPWVASVTCGRCILMRYFIVNRGPKIRDKILKLEVKYQYKKYIHNCIESRSVP